jgi:hypothetical protein
MKHRERVPQSQTGQAVWPRLEAVNVLAYPLFLGQ